MSITIPDNVTNIGWGAFAGCVNLTSVTLPDCIKDFGLIEKSIAGDAVHISSDIFLGCQNLAEITVKGKTQAEAEALLAGTKYPETCEIKTWSFQPKGDYVQLSSLSGFTTDDGAKNYRIDISSDGAAYVHVPWSGGGEIPDTYKTYAETSTQLSNDGYAT